MVSGISFLTIYGYDRRFLFSGTHIPEDTSGPMQTAKPVEQKMSQDAVKELFAVWLPPAKIAQVKPQSCGAMKDQTTGPATGEGMVWTTRGHQTRLKKSPVQLINLVPALGDYGSNEYKFRERILLVEMQPLMLLRADLPGSMKIALERVFGKPLERFMADALAAGRRDAINFCCVVHGTLKKPSMSAQKRDYEIPQDVLNTNNMLFHGFLTDINPLIDGTIRGNVTMGIFGADGMHQVEEKTAMPFNTLENREVTYRYFNRFEPDNARIAVDKKRSLATCWSVGIVDDRKEQKSLVITYHLLANDALLAEVMVNETRGNTDLIKVLQVIRLNLEKIDETKVTPDDRRAFNGFLSLLSMFLGE